MESKSAIRVEIARLENEVRYLEFRKSLRSEVEIRRERVRQLKMRI